MQNERSASALTNFRLVTVYDETDPCQHWFRQWHVAWRHQAITWTKVISAALWHSAQGNFTGIAQDIFSWYRFENRSRYLFLIQIRKSLFCYYNHISQGPGSWHHSAVIRAATYQKRLQRPSLSIVVSSNCGSVLQRKREAVRFTQQRPVVRKESHANVSSSWTWCVARNLELGWLGYIE